MKKTTTANKDTIVKLSEYQHARLRTEMWLGSRSPHTQSVVNWTGTKLEVQEQTWTPAVYSYFREILDNSLDELIGHGHGSKIDISYDPSCFLFEIIDDGRGIPIDWDPVEKMHKATLALTHTRAGRNFGEREEVRGTNGVGSSIVVNCSEYFHVDIYRDGMKFSQEYKEGTELFDQLQIFDPKIVPLKGKTGTRIVFKLSKSVFANPKLPLGFVEARVFEIAAAHPNIKFSFNGKKISVKPTIERTFFDSTQVMKLVIDQPKFTSQYILVPNFTSGDEIVHTTVNDIPAFNGGQHIDTFKRLFYGGLIKSLERESRKRGLTPNKSDISDSLLIYNVTTMHAPNFDSQSKTRLINEEVDAYIKTFFDDEANLDKLIKSNRTWIDEIYERCARRTQKRDDADINKANKKMLRTKVPSLMDATGRDRTKCILLITEGNCLDEKTKVLAVDDGKFMHKEIRNINIGDLVLTHRNNLKPVTHISKKVTSCLEIKTVYGSIISSGEHRHLVYNKETAVFDFIKSSDIDPLVHQLVKNRFSDINQLCIIEEISISDGSMPLKIKYNNNETISIIESTADHCFGIYDIEEARFVKLRADELIESKHALVMCF